MTTAKLIKQQLEDPKRTYQTFVGCLTQSFHYQESRSLNLYYFQYVLLNEL